MKIDANQFINMIMIHDSVGRDVCSILPQLHAITGSDTAAYKFNIGKVRVLKKVIKDPSSTLLISKLRTTVLLSDDYIEKAMQFIQTVMCGTRKLRKYKSEVIQKSKNKIFSFIPADPHSIAKK